MLKQFNLASQTILFHPSIGPFQVLLHQARVNLEAMAMKVYFTFPKLLALREPHNKMVYVISKTLIGGSFLSAEMQSVYFTAPTDYSFKRKGENLRWRYQ